MVSTVLKLNGLLLGRKLALHHYLTRNFVRWFTDPAKVPESEVISQMKILEQHFSVVGWKNRWPKGLLGHMGWIWFSVVFFFFSGWVGLGVGLYLTSVAFCQAEQIVSIRWCQYHVFLVIATCLPCRMFGAPIACLDMLSGLQVYERMSLQLR